MTGWALAARLGRRGMPSAELEAKRTLIEQALGVFEPFAGRAADRAWWVPGRLEVFGKHTDYAGGHSLVCAVPRGLVVLAGARRDTLVRVRDARRREEVEIDPAQAAPDEPGAGWRHYVRVAVRRLHRNFPGARFGCDLVLASDLPSASGMSSSSALVIGTAAALASVADLPSHAAWRRQIRTAHEEAGYYACIENGMTFGTLAGDSGVGTHGGSEDHVAIVCSRPAELSAWRFVPVRHVASVPVPAGWTFVIAASGVAARKTGPAMASYNRLSREAAALLELWRRDAEDAPSLAAALSRPGGPVRLRDSIRRSGDASIDPDRLERRLAQFIREDARVLGALDACRAGDRESFGALAAASQADAETLLSNQVPETIALVQTAREHGAFAASAFGAGFGGSVWALVDSGDAGAFTARWMSEYRRWFPHRAAATAFAAHPGPGLTRVG